LKRRQFLIGLGGVTGLGAAALGVNVQQYGQSQHRRARQNFTVVGQHSLRQRAAAKGLLFGAATHGKTLATDPTFAQQFRQECAIVVPEGELKWRTLRPKPDQFNFQPGDWLADFARRHQLLLRGHTLVWHGSMPDWLPQVATAQNAETLLTEHISRVVKHYAGQVHSWDVVNEAIWPQDQQPYALRHTIWHRLLGADYIELAFKTAAAADPKAMLVYNDFGLDYDTWSGNQKRAAVLALLERLKTRGTPIHALGIQAHLWGKDSLSRFNPRRLRQFIRDVASLGLKVIITELDVADLHFPAPLAIRDRLVAAAYADYLQAVLAEPAVIAILTWGLSDRYTWLAKDHPRSDHLSVRPLPLDEQLQRKLAWNAIARSFDHCPKR
jgi:endo-1,4-beta-xylanase